MVNVHGGDTLTLLVGRVQVHVRLLDIDAPEYKQPFGTRSRQFLGEICAGTQALLDGTAKDRYGRTLARVTCAGVDPNTEQVRRDMAWVFVRYAPKDPPLHAVQAKAKAARPGL